MEFTIQLLQLVHGQPDPDVRQRATLDALVALADQGYIGRVEAAEFGAGLPLPAAARAPPAAVAAAAHPPHARRRGRAAGARPGDRAWHPAPTSSPSSGSAPSSRCARLHERLFYRPLLSAVAALPEDGLRALERAGRGAARGDRLPRPAGRAAPHRRADRRSVAACDHPAQPAARHAAVVRRGCRPRLRAARVPPARPTTSARRTGSCACCATRPGLRSG